MDIYWYNSRYGFPYYDVSKYDDIKKQLEVDFLEDIGYWNSTSIDVAVFEKGIRKLIYKLDYFRIVTNGQFNSQFTWMIIYANKVQPIYNKVVKGAIPYFGNLLHYFSPENINRRKINNERRRIALEKERKDSAFEQAILFMELPRVFSEEELVKKYRALCLKYHPDKETGSTDLFLKLQQHFGYLKSK